MAAGSQDMPQHPPSGDPASPNADPPAAAEPQDHENLLGFALPDSVLAEGQEMASEEELFRSFHRFHSGGDDGGNENGEADGMTGLDFDAEGFNFDNWGEWQMPNSAGFPDDQES